MNDKNRKPVWGFFKKCVITTTLNKIKSNKSRFTGIGET
jgi:hypothetical protein